jgi:hypothetical protein
VHLVGGVLLPASISWGLINPDFTPIHLTEQSQAILLVQLAEKEVGDQAAMKLERVVKGTAPAKLSLLLTGAPAEHAKAAREHLARAAGKPMLLFCGQPGKKHVGYLHVQGQWLRLAGGEGGTWQLQLVDGDMVGVWNGGTDMLLRCVEYVLAEGAKADVPVAAGTAWRAVRQIASVGGKPTRLAAVDLAGDGRLCLHVACPAGDKLLQYDAQQEAFVDAGARLALGARSRASAWADFNADGRLDLASFDGKALVLWCQDANGAFRSVRVREAPAIAPGCPGLATVAQGRQPVLVVGGAAPPAMLIPAGPGAFSCQKLPAAEGDASRWREPHAPLVADFTNDAVPDIILPFRKEGLLYVGSAKGGFERPRPCGVDSAKGGGCADVGDLDADGWLDVLVAGTGGVKVFHNRRDGTFQETLLLSGEISYKAQPYASSCGIGDFNNDSHQDLFVTYAHQAPSLQFNRGFRSFGQAPKLELALDGVVEALADGQVAGLLADLDHDGAEDFVLALANGEVYCALNEMGGEDALGIHAVLPAAAGMPGPVRVTAFAGNRCLGARSVVAGGRPAFFGIVRRGVYVLKWRLPGRSEQVRRVVVASKAARELLVPAGAEAGSPTPQAPVPGGRKEKE